MLAFRAILAAAALPGSLAIVVPWILARGGRWSFEPGALRGLGAVTAALGLAGLVWCIVNFAREGRGTLAPVDPPRFVVRGGLYRYVRNPMYLCVLTLVLGEALAYGSGAVAAYALVVALGFHLFVVLYEEPTLRATFGADYEDYVRRVPRWIPRIPRA
jgi:protein-S-isoprenylcysteine O-methyltransferase Ste14